MPGYVLLCRICKSIIASSGEGERDLRYGQCERCAGPIRFEGVPVTFSREFWESQWTLLNPPRKA